MSRNRDDSVTHSRGRPRYARSGEEDGRTDPRPPPGAVTEGDTSAEPLWRCPSCGRPFAQRNQSHSCGPWTVDDHLRRAAPEVAALYDGFVRLVERTEPFTLAPAKTRIGFQVRMIFAAVTLRRRWLDAHVVLPRRLHHPRVRRVESLGPRSHVHHFRISEPGDLDGTVESWLAEAREVGAQRHVERV
jgi:hypothetical protein